MHIAIIGGSGFIGKKLCNLLRNNFIQFTVFDLVSNNEFKENTKFFDITSDESKLDGNFDAIINLAAVHRDDEKKEDYIKVNVEGARKICSLASKKNINKIIFTSSVAVYGINIENADEDSPTKPFNNYGKSKLEAEKIYQDWQSENPDLNTLVIIRPTVIFGEGNKGNVYNLINQIKSGFFLMVGNGNNKKSMAYVGNVSEYLFKSINLNGKIYIKNYVDKPDLKTRELVEVIKTKVSSPNSFNIRIPLYLGLFLGRLFDLISFLINRKLPISYIRIKKFTSNSVIETKNHPIEFKPSTNLKEGLLNVMENDF